MVPYPYCRVTIKNFNHDLSRLTISCRVEPRQTLNAARQNPTNDETRGRHCTTRGVASPSRRRNGPRVCYYSTSSVTVVAHFCFASEAFTVVQLLSFFRLLPPVPYILPTVIMLQYDDSAFSFFALSMITFYILPCTL